MTPPLRAILRPGDLGASPLELDTDASIGRRTVGIGGIVWRPGRRLEAWSERLAGRRLPGNGELLALEVGLRRVAALVGAEPLRAWTDSQAAVSALLRPRTPLDKAVLAAAEAFPALVVEWVPRWCLPEVDLLSVGRAAPVLIPSTSIAERLRAQNHRESDGPASRLKTPGEATSPAPSLLAALPELVLDAATLADVTLAIRGQKRSGVIATCIRRTSSKVTVWRVTFSDRPPLLVDYGGNGRAVRRVALEAPE